MLKEAILCSVYYERKKLRKHAKENDLCRPAYCFGNVPTVGGEEGLPTIKVKGFPSVF